LAGILQKSHRRLPHLLLSFNDLWPRSRSSFGSVLVERESYRHRGAISYYHNVNFRSTGRRSSLCPFRPLRARSAELVLLKLRLMRTAARWLRRRHTRYSQSYGYLVETWVMGQTSGIVYIPTIKYETVPCAWSSFAFVSFGYRVWFCSDMQGCHCSSTPTYISVIIDRSAGGFGRDSTESVVAVGLFTSWPGYIPKPPITIEIARYPTRLPSTLTLNFYLVANSKDYRFLLKNVQVRKGSILFRCYQAGRYIGSHAHKLTASFRPLPPNPIRLAAVTRSADNR
jgi:hypothetical protein